MRDWKELIDFVLVEPTEPQNVGASARAITNMGFRNLSVVNPPHDPDDEARRLAHGAEDVLKSAKIFSTFGESIAKASLVIGSSRRTGKRKGKRLSVEEAARKAMETARRGGRVAMLFGRERTGLIDPELEECAYVIHIPADPRQPSLNLAQAVMLVAYELAKLKHKASAEGEGEELSTHERQAEVVGKLRRVLELLDYRDNEDNTIARKILRIIKHVLGRAALTKSELYSLNGICARLIKRLEK